MTARMQEYRRKKEAQGLVQVRVWVPKEHEEFIKFLSQQCRSNQTAPKMPERYGRRASDKQIQFAETLARIRGKESPKHLYDHHISLAGWMWSNGGKPMTG